MYVGQTGKTMDIRVQQHVGNVNGNKNTLAVADHMCQRSHKPSLILDVDLIGVICLDTTTAVKFRRRKLESAWIRLLQTRAPLGMNRTW